MQIPLAQLGTNAVYHLMTQVVVPRPIAWVLTHNEDGGHNLAPFSYFSAVSSSPAVVMISIGRKPDGSEKDTFVNLQARQRCVIHIASSADAPMVSATAASLPFGESEVEANNIELVPWNGTARIRDLKVAMSGKLLESHLLGGQQIVFIELDTIYIDDAIASSENERILVDSMGLDPLARLGGSEFANLGQSFRVARPK